MRRDSHANLVGGSREKYSSLVFRGKRQISCFYAEGSSTHSKIFIKVSPNFLHLYQDIQDNPHKPKRQVAADNYVKYKLVVLIECLPKWEHSEEVASFKKVQLPQNILMHSRASSLWKNTL
ncbi:hypothetical protein NQ318_004715 [Aromia moschata]|uniref:Uncharacterized protein n=1 Tax=Aromia moschata TaxID=1265417 RepID=A0AAV8XCG8_9CUCU|nr:hypothetical protein NQ318_004715 [Aromia moschata]